MIIKLANMALMIAFASALVQAFSPYFSRVQHFYRSAQLLHFIWISIAFFLLIIAFISNDFSLQSVFQHSAESLPLLYKITGVWGFHEGSLLLWVWILAGWGSIVDRYARPLAELRPFIASVMGVISVCFLAFLIFFSNPFFPLPYEVVDGNELNPLLQDVALAIHPPLLYLGYVGMAVPFSIVCAALLRQQLTQFNLRAMCPWILLPWLFLTLGIAVGSWWAYYELGWGGWWFWDPVENASFMPWLVATALIHSANVSEKRNLFLRWTALLAILAFVLSLLGSFLIRSGVITSVHAFANDPDRGLFLLAILVLLAGGSLLLYNARSDYLRRNESFQLLSREGGLLFNNVVFIAATCTVCLGTLYPLLVSAFGWDLISIGEPYYNQTFAPLMLPALLLMGIVPYLRWRGDRVQRLLGILKTPWVVFALVFSLLSLVISFKIIFSLAIFAWIVLHSCYLLFRYIKTRKRPSTSFLGMTVSHFGVAVFFLGATLVTQLGEQHEVEIAPGSKIEFFGYQFNFKGVSDFVENNYQGKRASIEVSNGHKDFSLYPEKRFYSNGMVMTEAAIKPRITHDIYISLGEQLTSGAWSFRIAHKPQVRLVWLGAILIALGALFSASDRRYYRRVA